jgi:hypothetical protein
MTTTEKLQAIKARCETLLETASKRWTGELISGVHFCAHSISDDIFIASCAGPAEAGWRATIAAIDLILLDEPLYVGYFHSENELMSFKIVAAWEGLI